MAQWAGCSGRWREGEMKLMLGTRRSLQRPAGNALRALALIAVAFLSMGLDVKTVEDGVVREVREAQLDPNVERRVLVTGLRALAGRRDLEVS